MTNLIQAFLSLIVATAFVLLGCSTHPTGSSPIILPIMGLPSRVAILAGSDNDPLLQRDPLLESAYATLELKTGQVLREINSVILDRTDLASVRAEQWSQYQPGFAEETVVPVGRLLGAEILFVYHITIPNFRERLLARFNGSENSVMVQAKVIRVQTGELVWSYSTVAQAPMADEPVLEYNEGLRHALKEAVDDMLATIQQAVSPLALPTRP